MKLDSQGWQRFHVLALDSSFWVCIAHLRQHSWCKSNAPGLLDRWKPSWHHVLLVRATLQLLQADLAVSNHARPTVCGRQPLSHSKSNATFFVQHPFSPSTSSSSSSSVYCCSSSSQTNTSSSCATTSEHWCIAQHIWYNEESDMTASDVYLIKMRHSSISGCLLYIFELNVHVVFCFEQFSSVDLARR